MLFKKTQGLFYTGILFFLAQSCKMDFVNPAVFSPVTTLDSVGNVVYNAGSNVISIQGYGNVKALGNTHLYERGFIFDDTSQTPTVDDNDKKIKMASFGIGAFNSNLTPLPPGRKVYCRTYSLYYKGASYSDVNVIETPKSRPVLTASAVDTNQISSTTAKFKGVLVFTGGENVTEQGFVFGTSPNPTLSDNRLDTGNFVEGALFTGEASGLTPDKTYYFRAFATNSLGITYSSQFSFKTKK